MVANHGTGMPYLKGDNARYLYGPGNPHPPEGFGEGLTIKELEDGVEGYKRLIMHALKSPFPPPHRLDNTCPIR